MTVRRTWIIAILLFVALSIVGLGLRPLIVPDEPRYGIIPAEMVENGNWLALRMAGFVMRVRGDGRTYQLDTRIQAPNSRRDISYRADFKTVANEWTEVKVPFSAFKPSWRGTDLEGRVATFDPANLSSMGIMIYDGKDGPFRLEVETIGVY